jgi:hypothetical protein
LAVLEQNKMTKQALNSIELYKGQDAFTIKRALLLQNKDIVKELSEYFKVPDINSLAIKLSIGLK